MLGPLSRNIVALVGGAINMVAATGATALTDRFAASLEHPAIEYGTRPRTDQVARLDERLGSGDATLAFDRPQGYLRALLEAFDVPVESQVLVFSKTSLQWNFISPANPRAIYFNDDVVIAWVRGAPAIELAALDPQQGVMFYALGQVEWTRGFQRPRSCLQCHVSPETLGVPGLAVGSAVADPDGVPYTSRTVDHRTMIESRWGGGYVTGDTGIGRHVGNTVATDPSDPMLRHEEANRNIDSVEGRFDTSGYLTPFSDIVALMVLEHQTHMTNLLTRVGWEFRLATHERHASDGLFVRSVLPIDDTTLHEVVNALVDYMLFVDEAPLTDRMIGSSGFSSTFVARGPFDQRGRTLREVELDRRLFRFPCSYMIYTASFDALPTDAKAAVYRRMWEVLSGSDADPKYTRLSSDDRRNIIDILRDTKADLPFYFANGG